MQLEALQQVVLEAEDAPAQSRRERLRRATEAAIQAAYERRGSIWVVGREWVRPLATQKDAETVGGQLQ